MNRSKLGKCRCPNGCAWVRHNQSVAGLLAVLAVVLLVGFTGVAWKWREAVAEREAKEGQRLEAEKERKRAQDALGEVEKREAETQKAQLRTKAALYYSNVVRARFENMSNDLAGSERSLERCRPEHRGWEWHFLKSLNHADLFTLEGHTGFANAVAYSPNSRYIASAGGGNPYWGNPGARFAR